MAKRPTARTGSDDPSQPAQPRARRSRATRPPQPQEQAQDRAQEDATAPTESDTFAARADERSIDRTSELPGIPEPGDAADRAQRSESMASEPSEEDIRLRAYHRYLERGAGHGRHFDDWLEAERELRAAKRK